MLRCRRWPSSSVIPECCCELSMLACVDFPSSTMLVMLYSSELPILSCGFAVAQQMLVQWVIELAAAIVFNLLIRELCVVTYLD